MKTIGLAVECLAAAVVILMAVISSSWALMHFGAWLVRAFPL